MHTGEGPTGHFSLFLYLMPPGILASPQSMCFFFWGGALCDSYSLYYKPWGNSKVWRPETQNCSVACQSPASSQHPTFRSCPPYSFSFLEALLVQSPRLLQAGATPTSFKVTENWNSQAFSHPKQPTARPWRDRQDFRGLHPQGTSSLCSIQKKCSRLT